MAEEEQIYEPPSSVLDKPRTSGDFESRQCLLDWDDPSYFSFTVAFAGKGSDVA
jgi:hypothetical protein